MEDLGLELTISKQMNISTPQFPHGFLLLTLLTMNCLFMSLLALSGAPPGVAVRWMVTLTIRPPSTCSTMAGPVVRSVSILLENSGGSKHNGISNGILSTLTQSTIYSVTVCLGGETLNSGVFSMSEPRNCVRQKYLYLRIIFALNSKFDSGLDIIELDKQVQEFQQNAFAEGTKSNLQTQVNAYFQFCKLYNISPLPATGPNLSRYATWLAVSKRAKSIQTVKNYLSAIRTLSKLYGYSCPTPTTDGGLGLTVRGLAKKLGKNQKRMFPITKTILKKLIQPGSEVLALNNSEQLAKMNPIQYQHTFGTTIIHQVCSALFLLLFLSFLRAENVIPKTCARFDKVRQPGSNF